MPDLSLESKYSNYVIAGVDEVGRGSWAGPVVAGAVIFNQTNMIESINDSKKLTAQKRKKLSILIWELHICAIGMASVEEINELGINPATFLAIERALESLPNRASLALVDGNYKKKFKISSIDVTKGDSKSLSIAAASIVAKVYRDNLMQELAKEFPAYGWERNAGYGTKIHIESLHKYGPCPHHRIHYKPVANAIISNS
jgi:ribonuclease HII